MIKNARFILLYLILLSAGLYINFHSDIAVPMNKPFAQFPLNHQGWQSVSQTVFSENVLRELKPTDYLSREYFSPDGRVSLYIGYHNGGKESGEIHSPRHCLPGSGWQKLSDVRMVLDKQEEDLQLVKAVYQKGENRQLFLYWFQVKGKTLADEYSLKIVEITNSMVHRRRDAAFVRISIPIEREEEVAVSAGLKFVRDFYPLIRDFLPS